MNSNDEALDKSLTEILDGTSDTLTEEERENVVSLNKQCNMIVDRKRCEYIEKVKVGEAYESQAVSNFILEPLRTVRCVDQPGKPTARYAIIKSTGEDVEVMVDKNAFASKAKFCEWIQSQGNYQFWGSSRAFTWIALNAFPADMPLINERHILGHDPESGAWLLANGAVSSRGEIVEMDRNGVMVIDDVKYSIAGSILSEKTLTMKPDFKTPSKDPFRRFREVFFNTQKLWGHGVELLWGYAVASVFRPKIFAEATTFPLLIVTSPRSSGKNSLVRVVSQFYGYTMNRAPFTLSTGTLTQYFTATNRLSAIPIWVDELHKAKPESLVPLHQNYDGTGRAVGTLDPFKTKTREQRCGAIVTGEYIVGDSAFMTRAVHAEIVANQNTDLFNAIVDNSDTSAAFVKILKDYNAYYRLFKDLFKKSQDEFVAMGTESRIASNYALVKAGIDLILQEDERTARFKDYITFRSRDTKESMPVVDMLEKLPYMVLEKGLQIPWRVCTKRHALIVANTLPTHYKATFPAAQQFDFKRSDILNNSEAAKLLIKGHPKDSYIRARMAVRGKDGAAVDTLRWCLFYDMDNPTVRTVADALRNESRTDPAKFDLE
jgi:hypothetical protein